MADKTPTRPDIKTFLGDPSFQADRELLEAFFEHFLARKEEEVRKRREEEESKNPPNFFDRMFGGR